MELHAGLIMKKRFITWWFCCKKTAYYYVIVAFPYHAHLLFGGQPNPIMVGNLIVRWWVGPQTLWRFRLKYLSIDERVGPDVVYVV